MPVGWAYLGYLTALASVVVVVLWASLVDTFPFNLWSLVVLAAVLLPAWAIWLAMRSEDLRLGDQEVDLLQGELREDAKTPPPEGDGDASRLALNGEDHCSACGHEQRAWWGTA